MTELEKRGFQHLIEELHALAKEEDSRRQYGGGYSDSEKSYLQGKAAGWRNAAERLSKLL